jgi:hypothetical protein
MMPFEVTPIARNVTEAEADHAKWLCQVLDGATISAKGIVRGVWFAYLSDV